MIYDENKDDGLVVIAAAEDTGGEAAAGRWYDEASTTYPSLIDEKHTISSLYHLVNVPSAVWIDEQRRVVRVDEGSYAARHKIGDFEFGRDDYPGIVRDWVRHGAGSRYLQQPLSAKHVRQQTADEATAEAAFKLGVYFLQHGEKAKADHCWQRAQELNPESWNYHRQEWTFDGEEAARENWRRKVATLGRRPYYQPIAGVD